jgi:hypothetical protein
VTADGSPAAAAALASGVGGRSSPQPPDPGPRAPHRRDRLAFVFPAYVGKARSVDPKRVAGRPREELAASRRAIRRRSAAATAPAREWTSRFRMMLLTWERAVAGEHERVSDLVRGSVGSAESFDQAARHLARDRRPPRRRWCAGPAGMASAGCALSSSCSPPLMPRCAAVGGASPPERSTNPLCWIGSCRAVPWRATGRTRCARHSSACPRWRPDQSPGHSSVATMRGCRSIVGVASIVTRAKPACAARAVSPSAPKPQ